jgi:hypothetical protein
MEWSAMTDPKETRGKRDEVRVIDRRMFTPEGEKRVPDIPREEAPAPQAPSAGPPGERAGRPDSGADRAPGPAPSRDEQVASAHFVNLVRNLATTAAASLGEIPNPFSGQTEVDLEGARQVIELLQALQVKTRGNLAPEESRLLDSLLYDLRVAAVNLQTKAKKTS